MNLVIVARRPGVRRALRGDDAAADRPSPVADDRDPVRRSRTGRRGWTPGSRRTASCPAPTPPETCAETIHVVPAARPGATSPRSRRRSSSTTCPVTVWWPGEPSLARPETIDLLSGADRLVVDGSSWSGDGLSRLRELAALQETTRLAISDFALVRQSRWREAIASIFDDPGVPALPAPLAADRGHLRDPRRDRRARCDEPREADLSRRLAGVAPRAGRGPAARAGVVASLGVVRPPGAEPDVGRPRPGGDAVRRPRRGRRSSSGRSCRRCRPGRRCGSSSSPSGAAPSCVPT